MIELAALENARRYRAIASLCRQAANFRPGQQSSLLQQAEDWERLAMMELEAHDERNEVVDEDLEPELEAEAPEAEEAPQAEVRWWLPRPEGLFAGLGRADA